MTAQAAASSPISGLRFDRETAVELIAAIPDESIPKVVGLLRVFTDPQYDVERSPRKEKFPDRTPEEIEQAEEAFKRLMKFRKCLPADFDADAELAAYRDERYGCAD